MGAAYGAEHLRLQRKMKLGFFYFLFAEGKSPLSSSEPTFNKNLAIGLFPKKGGTLYMRLKSTEGLKPRNVLGTQWHL